MAIKHPEVIRHYNENMGVVDLLDQLISYIRISEMFLRPVL
jgi:hypothetical protein